MAKFEVYAFLSNVDDSIMKSHTYFKQYGFDILEFDKAEIIDLFHRWHILYNETPPEYMMLDPVNKRHILLENRAFCLYQKYSTIKSYVLSTEKLFNEIVNKFKTLKIFSGNPCISYILYFEDGLNLRSSHENVVIQDSFTINGLNEENILKFLSLENPLLDNSYKFSYDNLNLSYSTDILSLRFISLMQGIEAIYNRNPTELSFRIPLYCAFFIEKEPAERYKIFNKMRDLYKIRSILVHTGDIKKVNNKHIEIVSEYLRRTLQNLIGRDINKENLIKEIEEKIYNIDKNEL